MKIQFKSQEYQTDATNAVVDIFDGQGRGSSIMSSFVKTFDCICIFPMAFGSAKPTPKPLIH